MRTHIATLASLLLPWLCAVGLAADFKSEQCPDKVLFLALATHLAMCRQDFH
jgi:hypothetical protein